MYPPRRGHSPHGNRDHEVGDSKKGPNVGHSARAKCFLRQQRSDNDGMAAGRNVTNPRRQRELPAEAPVRPKHEEDAATEAINLSCYEPLQRYRANKACDASRQPQANGRSVKSANRTGRSVPRKPPAGRVCVDAKGRDLGPIVSAVRIWGRKHAR